MLTHYAETVHDDGSVVIEESHVHGADELRAAVTAMHAKAYKRYRDLTKPYRRAFGGDRRAFYALALSARGARDRDAGRVREAVILGARTIADVSQRTGLRQARIRRIVRVEGIKAVAA